MKKQKKRTRLFTLFLVFVVIFTMVPGAVFAHDREEHNKELEKVLFGKGFDTISRSLDNQNKIQMLESASYLAIDQDRSEGSEDLEFLKCQGVKRLPELSEIDLTGIFYGNHRNYTHRGWDFVYPIKKGEKQDAANWPERKKLLCLTINEVFDFGFRNELFGKACKQCNSFGALVYYIHILGDHIENDSYKVNDLTMPLAREHADENNLDVFVEIKKHSEILFSSQKDSITYVSFMQELDVLADEARTLAGTKGGINDSNFEQYHRYAEELMELLTTYVPLLLENEEFFKAEFYTDK